MALWTVLAGMTGAAALLLLWPLSRSRAPRAGEADDAAFYRAALADIERDQARGLMPSTEAEAARAEAARRLLRSADGARRASSSSNPIHRRLAAVLVLMVVPAVAVPIYATIGSPNLSDQPLALRRAADPASVQLAEAVARIEARLAQEPNDGAGHEVIAPVYLRLGRIDDAVRAYSEALRLNGESADRLANLAEALIARAEGVVTVEANQKLSRAAELDARQPKARYYLALAREQDGDRAGAAEAYQSLLADYAPDAPWVGAVRARLDALRQIPAGGEAIAALPADQRTEAIRGMVEGLAQRLAANGGSLEEWARLIRARMALGEKDKAAQALADARRALPANDQLDALSREFGL